MDINLEVLKTEILEYLERSDFGIFRSNSGGLEETKIITWDSDRFPDYRQFLEAATKAGVRLILFAARELAEEEITEVTAELEELELDRNERRDLDRRLNAAKRHVGETCALELAFGYNSQLFVYEARPDWYEEFLDACEEVSEEIGSLLTGPDDEPDGPGSEGLGGYYSKN